MPQTETSTEDFQKRKAIADAEKAAIEAEIARDETKKKLADHQALPDPRKATIEAKLDAAKAAKEIADAAKAQADAAKSQAEAEFAALKAKIGEVPSSGISGEVKLEQGAATMETALLAARATVTASNKIAKAVVPFASANPNAKILVFAAGETLDFQAATGFFAQQSIVLQALTDAASRRYCIDLALIKKGLRHIGSHACPPLHVGY